MTTTNREGVSSRGRPLALTGEQAAVVQSRSGALRVVAFAGAGKTSTLRAYAEARPGERMLYVAFNAAVAKEARESFPAHVSCSTMHALAYRVIGRRYQHKLRTSLRAHQAARALGLNPAEVKDLRAADGALVALRHYLSSACRSVEEFGATSGRQHRAEAVAGAERLWQQMVNPHHQLPMLHDGYLKLFQLSKPQLGFGVILFDEAQDANPVTLAILRAQQCRKVFVGDPHQQIYQFRYAINGMAAPELEDELCLSESFRYGAEIAAAANRLLALKGEALRVRGGRRREASGTRAYLARGNAAVVRYAIELARAGERVHWVGGVQGYRLEQLLDVWRLRTGLYEQVKDPFLRGFGDYDAFCCYCESQDQRDLKAWVTLLERYERLRELPGDLAQVQALALDQATAGVVSVCTAHKSKGLEFGVVTLAEDFPSAELLPKPPELSPGPEPGPGGEEWAYNRSDYPGLWDELGFRGAVVLPEEELNLRYVAVTRAEGDCHSGLWPAPMFEHLEAYRQQHPRFLLLDSLESVKKRSRLEVLAGASSLPLVPEVKRSVVLQRSSVARTADQELVPPQGCPKCPDATDTLQHGNAEAVSKPGAGFVWNLGALDTEQVQVVVAHYRHRYPALDWGWLLQSLAELRLLGEPRQAVVRYLEQHQLRSAEKLVERFLLDVGLWVVAGEGLAQA